MRLNLKRFKHQAKTLIALVLAIAVPTASAIPTYHIRTTQTASNTAPSTMAAGGDITLVAHNPNNNQTNNNPNNQPNNNPKPSNISVTGSRINSDKDIQLIADNDITLQAAKETSSEHSQHKSSSASAGVKISVGQEIGISLIAGASKGKGKGQGNSTHHTNTTLSAKNKLQLSSGQNTTLHGAIAKANRIQANIGSNLHIQSPQNTEHYHASSKTIGGNLSIGISNAPLGASISKSKTNINSHYQSTQNTSGLQAGDGGFNINVKGNTKLIGGIISSTQAAINNQQNQFNTNTLTLQNLNNQAAYTAKGSSITVGIGSMLGASAGIAQDSGQANSTTQSGISGIAGNAAIRTGDKDSGIAPIFNQQQVQDEIQAQIAITAAFGKQASKAIGNYATDKQNQANRKAQAAKAQPNGTIEGKTAQEWEQIANNWKEGGIWRTILHTTAGALTGGVEGALGAGTASLAAPAMNKLENNFAAKLAAAGMSPAKAQATAKASTGLLSAALGAAVGGNTGAITAINTDFNNRQLHFEEKKRIKELAKGDRKREAQLTLAACALVKCSAEFKKGSALYVMFKAIEDKGNSPERAEDRALLRKQMGPPEPYHTVARKPLFAYSLENKAVDGLALMNNTYQITTRLGGLVQATAGAIGTVAAAAGTGKMVALCPASGVSCLAIPAGAFATVSGADYTQAGVVTLLKGKQERTIGAKLISEVMGTSPETAELMYGAANIASSMGVAAFASKIGTVPAAAKGGTVGAVDINVTGQAHHLLGKKITRALDSHPTLKGAFDYSRTNTKYIYNALDAAAHKGYQTWHRQYDTMVVRWLQNNPSATPVQFNKYLHNLHQQTWLKNRIPNVNLLD